ncbi:hypothetical protein A4A49_25151 [Nicotiana attenuata]|uniref:DUF4283 domain-containing protein n=1 Tax=Nicotiana attenuata TaxID=49451 RepID=A0A314LED8_NICAT|nr:hypothetical protein A4A49_25151 [Nicotiana attenuata]
MGTPGGSLLVNPINNHALKIVGSNLDKENTPNIHYGKAVVEPAKHNAKGNRLGDPNVKARITTHNGMPAVIFKASDYYGVMAEECKYTIIGKFLRSRPNIERIRSVFAEKNLLKGDAKIGAYDFRTVFIDVTNDEDCKSVRYRRSMDVDGMVMWLQKWSSDFKSEEDSPKVPIWVLLPELPFHCHTWYYIRQILTPVEVPLSMDIATDYRTRPCMVKVRVEVDLTKPLIQSIWMGSEGEANPLKDSESNNFHKSTRGDTDGSKGIKDQPITQDQTPSLPMKNSGNKCRELMVEENTENEETSDSSRYSGQEVEQEEVYDRGDQIKEDGNKAGKIGHTTIIYPLSSIDTEVKNQPPIQIVVDLFSSEHNRADKQNTTKGEITIAPPDSNSYSEKDNSKIHSEDGIEESEEWMPGDRGRSRQRKIGRISREKCTSSHRGKEQKLANQALVFHD